MGKEEIKKILEEYLTELSNISMDIQIDNPVLMSVVCSGIKQISLALVLIDKV